MAHPDLVHVVKELLQQADAAETQRITEARQRNESAENGRKHRDLLHRQTKKISPCDGATRLAVREWLKQLAQAVVYLPTATEDTDIHTIIQDTSRGALHMEYEHFMSRQADRNNVPWASVQVAIREAFLGPDEEEAIKGELEQLKQGATENFPDFNRRFNDAAEDTYPNNLRQPAEDLILTNLYLRALQPSPIVDRIFDAEPRIVTLAGALQAASAAWSRQQRRERVTGHASNEMEIGAVNSSRSTQEVPMREMLTAVLATVKDNE